MNKYTVIRTSTFKKDLKRAVSQGLDIEELEAVVTKLANNQKLEPKYRDHSLKGSKKKLRECHINPDWLLIYEKDKKQYLLYLQRTGSHSKLLDM
jgi:mRNA interferase YafQ